MEERCFETVKGNKLIVKGRKSAIILEQEEVTKNMDGTFEFTAETFSELVSYLEEAANQSWGSLTPKECNSFGADYFEYYDRELDNNGYLRLGEYTLHIEKPMCDTPKLYQFNKRKMESFLYEVKQLS